MTHYVNKLNEAKADNFLDSISVEYTKGESTSPNVIKYTITSHEGHHKMLFIIEEVLERFHALIKH